MLEIERWLEEWCPSIDEYRAYEVWENYRVLPYAGGWLDQPESIHRLFSNCALWDEYLRLNSELPKLAGLPSFENS